MERPNHIDHPAAWQGQDMARTPELWVTTLAQDHITEIETAADDFIAAGHAIDKISSETFPLPSFGPILAGLREQMINGIGFSLIRGLNPLNYSAKNAATLFCGVGAHLGSARSQNAAGHILGHVRDVGADPSDVNTRIYQTSARQTFHTDSADVVGLLCLQDAQEGGDSLLVSTLTIYNQMMARAPELAAELFKPVATDRRGEVPEGEKPYFMIPVLNWHNDQLTGIYQRQYIESAQRFDDAPRLTDSYIQALDLFDEISNDPDIHLKMRLAPGDMQFVYNHTNLHDRTGFTDWPDPAQRRHLLRLWLSLPGDRELPPIFAQRYGSITIGNRGGIITKATRLHVPEI